MKKIVTSLIVLTVLAFTSNAQETGTFKDKRDGKVYITVTIGTQVWMAENLTYAPSSGNYWAWGDDNSNVETYGYLYDWETALDVCPAGWHLPIDEEWKELEMSLGMTQAEADDTGFRGTNEGSKLAGNAGLWAEGKLVNDEDFGTSGFTALPGGYRNDDGNFDLIGLIGGWWSATEGYSSYAWSRFAVYNDSDVSRDNNNKENGFSVRCLRD
jgi:uncharacterized protein (TIGR02145 family)